MKKTFFLTVTTVVALLISPASYSQQPASQSGITSIARKVATQIPEIKGRLNEPAEQTDHFLRYNIKGENGRIDLQIYHYKRPAMPTDWVVAAYDVPDFPAAGGIEWFTYDRKTGTLAATATPFELLPPSLFDKEEFGDDPGYWRTSYSFCENGNIVISASPGMSYYCYMLARWNGKDGFTLFKRAGFDSSDMEIAADNAETEKYVQNVVRPNFQRINAIKKWEYVETKESFDLSTEGAELTYYYSADGLEKMVAKVNGETYGNVTEYYFLDGRLFFIYDNLTKYGAPRYYDGPKTPDTKVERRWYLKGNKCVRGIGDNGKKLTRKQITEEFLGSDDRGGEYSGYMKVIRL